MKKTNKNDQHNKKNSTKNCGYTCYITGLWLVAQRWTINSWLNYSNQQSDWCGYDLINLKSIMNYYILVQPGISRWSLFYVIIKLFSESA